MWAAGAAAAPGGTHRACCTGCCCLLLLAGGRLRAAAALLPAAGTAGPRLLRGATHSAEVMGARLFTTTTTAGINRALAAHPLTCIGYVTACRYAVFTPVVFSIRQLGVPVPAELAMA